MKELKFKHHKSGIKSLIWNTDERWIDFEVSEEYNLDKVNKGIFNTHLAMFKCNREDFVREKVAFAKFDFDSKQYHRLEEQNKDQVIIYLVPKSMLLD